MVSYAAILTSLYFTAPVALANISSKRPLSLTCRERKGVAASRKPRPKSPLTKMASI